MSDCQRWGESWPSRLFNITLFRSFFTRGSTSTVCSYSREHDDIPAAMMLSQLSLLSLGVLGVAAQRGRQGQGPQACPEIHIFGARETTTPQGFGSAQTLVDLVLRRFPGATSEEIIYPAAGDDEYSRSVGAGILAVVKQTSAFAARCPRSIIIMHGYSQVCSGASEECNPTQTQC